MHDRQALHHGFPQDLLHFVEIGAREGDHAGIVKIVRAVGVQRLERMQPPVRVESGEGLLWRWQRVV